MLKNKLKEPPQKLWLLLLAGLVLRLGLSSFGTLELDFNTYLAWSNRLVATGLASFYQVWSDYLPGYLYILWFLGKLKLLLPFLPTVTLYKLPAILADMFSGYLIYKLLGKSKLRMLATAAYVFNPAILANSTLWGQTDSLVALAALLWLYWRRRRFYLASITLGLGMAIKPTLILLAPFALSHLPYALIVFMLTFIPFSPSLTGLPQFILDRVMATANQYPYTSVHAFNLWQLVHGSWQSDAKWQILGWSLFAAVALIAYLRFRAQPTKILATIFLSVFLLLTRMHERHLLPALPFLLLTSPALYVWYSFSYLLNLRFSYVAVTTAYQSQFLSFPATQIISLINLLGLGWLLSGLKLPKLAGEPFSLSLRAIRYMLLAILIFSLFARLYRLQAPAKFYFDEVYHAFTATEMLKNNPRAWEWWNPNPADVAYEWTHPPLAKEFMVVSMRLFGPNSFGWRFPAAILGVANIFLVYLLARRLFNSPTIGLLSAALFSLDGLNLVQSRIGMNDTYLLFFLRRNYFISSLTFGLALASKWSAIYLLPVLAITYLFQEKLQARKIFLLSIFYPLFSLVVYMTTYIPFLASGHTWSQFWELHQQMYWYHTQLVATHPYQSSAWSWPLDLRPVWYYVDYQDTTVANIYALGNPLIFWSGLLAVVLAILEIRSIRSIRNSPIVILIAGYLLLFLPWALSPRIMFLYHYLPATPFMVILLSWALTRIGFKFAIGYLLLAISLFLFFYPLWTALPVPQTWANIFFWLPSWK
jgi:dolichyl-phosphate-mannose-protein mannosyltransferase